MVRNYLSLSTNISCYTQPKSPRAKPPVTPVTPTPKKPIPWIWVCHRCRHKYSFQATPRCLSCSHRFCVKCVSELDYAGWRAYDNYWSRRTESAATKRRCLWITEELPQDSSTWGGPEEVGAGHDNGHYDPVAGKKGKDQRKVRVEDEVEMKIKEQGEGWKKEEHIWVGFQSEEFSVKMCEQNSEEGAAGEASTASRSRSRKRLPEINTAADAQDVPLYSAVRELLWDPLTSIGTGSFTWEESIFEEVDAAGGEDDDEPGIESCVKTHKTEKALMKGDESCIDPVLLTWVY